MSPDALYTASQVRVIDRAVIESAQFGMSGIDLMRRAAESAFAVLMSRYGGVKKLTVVCGPGNNGGDGYLLGACARKLGIAVRVVATANPRGEDAIAAAREFRASGGVVESGDAKNDAIAKVIADADLIVDALFGTGLTRAPQDANANLIDRINAARCPVLSLDIPSGLHADTGYAFSPCVIADLTVTFIARKLGLFTGNARAHCGEIIFDDLKIPADAYRAGTPAAHFIHAPTLPNRRADMHKGDAGRVWVVGGAGGMFGAALLAGEAALRCGSGLVTVASGAARLDWAALHCAELMSADALALDLAAKVDALVLGPGLGQSAWSEKVFARFIDCDCAQVVDADGLNLLAGNFRQSPARANRILTPHVGEAARLLQCCVDDVQADRIATAREIAAQFGGVCILKGAGSLVVGGDGDGDGNRDLVGICDNGNPGMASAGTGDVLSGVVGSLLGQGIATRDAAAGGAWIHGESADRAAAKIGQHGLLARDVIAQLAGVVAGC